MNNKYCFIERHIAVIIRLNLTVPSTGSMIHVGFVVSLGMAPVPVLSSPMIYYLSKDALRWIPMRLL